MLTWRNMECLYRHIHLTHFTQCTVGKSVGHNPGSNQPVVSCCVRIFYRSGAIIVPIPIPSVCVCTFKRNQSMRGGVDLSADGSDERKRKKQQNGKGKKGDWNKTKNTSFCVCVRELYIRETMLSMKALEPVRLENYGSTYRREKKVQQLVVFILFFFFVCPLSCPSLWLLMDGGLSGSGWLSLVSTWVCVWCSTKRTQTKFSVATRFHLIGWYSRSLFLFCFVCFFLFF